MCWCCCYYYCCYWVPRPHEGLYYTILYYTIIYYTMLYYTILYDTAILYYTILSHHSIYYDLLHDTTTNDSATNNSSNNTTGTASAWGNRARGKPSTKALWDRRHPSATGAAVGYHRLMILWLLLVLLLLPLSLSLVWVLVFVWILMLALYSRHTSSIRGAWIPASWPTSTSRRPLTIRSTRGLGPFFQIELLTASRAVGPQFCCVCNSGRDPRALNFDSSPKDQIRLTITRRLNDPNSANFKFGW